jgi:MYXO-CTERM domain-containing protein
MRGGSESLWASRAVADTGDVVVRAGRAAVLYAVMTVIVTWPLVIRLGDAVPGWSGDQAYNMWVIDTFWTQITAGKSPFVTSRILVPFGANLMEVNNAPVVAVLAGPFWWWGGEHALLAFFGVFCLLAPIGAGLGMRAAILALTADGWAASWAGFVYAASPMLLSFIGSPWHFKVAGAVLFPWVVAAFFRWHAQPTAGRLVVVSVGIWMLPFIDAYVCGMMLLACGVVTLIGMRRNLLVPIAVGIVANVALGLLVFRTVLPTLDPNDLSVGGETFWRGAHSDLRDVFVPGTALTVAFPGGSGVADGTGLRWNGPLGNLARFKNDAGPDPGSYYLGMGALGLLALALWRRWRDRRVWGLVAAGVLLTLCASGTRIDWGGVPIAEGAWTPWWWLMRIRVLQHFDLPRCFMLGAQAVLLMGAGVGMASLHWRRSAVGVLAIVLVVVDYGRIGIPMATFPIPDAIRVLAAEPEDHTLLELPMGLVESKGGFGSGAMNSVAMYWQTLHRKRRVACYISRVPYRIFSAFFYMPVLGDLLVMTNPNHAFENPLDHVQRIVSHLPSYAPDVVTAMIRTLDIGYIALVPGGVSDDDQQFYRDEIERTFAAHITKRQTWEDGFVVYWIA